MSNDEWQTPEYIIESVREVLGVIDLDPASSETANQRIQAERYFNKEHDGLNHSWLGSVYLNPPYSQPLCNRFTEKFVSEYHEGSIEQGILLCNFDSSTTRCQRLMELTDAVCLLKKRVAFIDPHTGKQKKGNRFAQAAFYVGHHVSSFRDEFDKHGKTYKNDDISFLIDKEEVEGALRKMKESQDKEQN